MALLYVSGSKLWTVHLDIRFRGINDAHLPLHSLVRIPRRDVDVATQIHRTHGGNQPVVAVQAAPDQVLGEPTPLLSPGGDVIHHRDQETAEEVGHPEDAEVEADP